MRARMYDPRIGRFTQTDPIRDRRPSAHYSYADNQPVQKADPTGEITIIVHGTWASRKYGADWWTSEGEFAKQLDSVVGDVWKIRTDNFRKHKDFEWSGANMNSTRLRGGADLKDYIVGIKKKYPNEPINIVAHSHGGNVAFTALAQLPADITVDNFILLGTPHMVKSRTGPSGDTIDEQAYADPNSFVRARNMYNIYSEEDETQTYWADKRHGFRERELNGGWIYTANQYCFGPKGNRIKNIRIDTNVGGLDAHTVLHNSAMGRFVGYLIQNGGNEKRARDMARLPDRIEDDDEVGQAKK